MSLQGGRSRPRVALIAVAVALLITAASALAAPAVAVPPAPAPTSTEISPGAPDPNPPLGGRDASGQVVGGDQLISRGLLQAPGTPPLPDGISAAGFVLSDLDTGAILAARDPHGRYQPASILKVLTSLVMLAKLPGAQQVIPSAAAAGTEGSAVGLVPGGAYTVDQLFTGMMLMSGNDATMALAEAAGGVDSVVATMNDTMSQLGAVDTVVQTPSGLDGWTQLTSAYDMALVLRQAVANPRLVAYDAQMTGQLPPQDVAGKQYGPIPLAHQGWQFLEQVPGALLVKSGFTDAARSTYLAAVQRGGHRYGVAFLRNERAPLDQWQQAAALFDWAAALPSGTAGVGRLIEPSSPLPTASPTPTAPPTSAAAPPPSITASSAPPPSPSATPSTTPTGSTSAQSTSAQSVAPGIAARGASGPTSGRSGVSGVLYALGITAAAVAIGVLGASTFARRARRRRMAVASRSRSARLR